MVIMLLIILGMLSLYYISIAPERYRCNQIYDRFPSFKFEEICDCGGYLHWQKCIYIFGKGYASSKLFADRCRCQKTNLYYDVLCNISKNKAIDKLETNNEYSVGEYLPDGSTVIAVDYAKRTVKTWQDPNQLRA